MINLSPELLIGVSSIDREHQDLLTLLDRLIFYNGMPSQSARLSEILDQLGTQLAKHFENEEQFLRSCGMPDDDVIVHVQAHSAIRKQYTQLNLDLMADKPKALSGAAGMVKQWIVGHLLKHDIKIRKYVAG